VSDDATEQSEEPSQPTLAYPQSRPMPYGSSPYAATVTPGSAIDRDVSRPPVLELADVWTAVLGTIGVVLVGVLAGFVWLWLAPRAMAVSDGKGKSGLLDPETKAFAGADVTFLFIGVAAGLLCGIVAAILARRRGVAVSVAMAVAVHVSCTGGKGAPSIRTSSTCTVRSQCVTPRGQQGISGAESQSRRISMPTSSVS